MGAHGQNPYMSSPQVFQHNPWQIFAVNPKQIFAVYKVSKQEQFTDLITVGQQHLGLLLMLEQPLTGILNII